MKHFHVLMYVCDMALQSNHVSFDIEARYFEEGKQEQYFCCLFDTHNLQITSSII